LRFLWPPVGSASIYGAYFVAVLAWLVSLAPLKIRTQSRAKYWMLFGLLVATLSVVFYGRLLSKYVVADETPENGTQYRVVGSERTATALDLEKQFGNLSDERLLQIAGLTDAAIKEMWTPESVDRTREELFMAILFLWISVNFTSSCFARSTFDARSK